MSVVWPTIEIKTDSGELKTGIAPLILSASRSTDIPAFFAEWFINRFRRGYIRWMNPFNRQSTYVSFRNVRLIVFWSKNPEPILPYLDELDKNNLNYYFQFTVNDYEMDGLEPGVPSLDKRIETFRTLSNRIGKEKVIWRFDPLILAGDLTVDKLINRVQGVGDKLVGCTEKLIISFADIRKYKKVQANLKRVGSCWRDFTQQEIEDLSERISRLCKTWRVELSTCAEEIDLTRFGITHNRCIDDQLIIRLFRHDHELMDFLSISLIDGKQKSLFTSTESAESAFQTPCQLRNTAFKDKGQRKACGCIVSKDIGQYDTCRHLCVYCYANRSAEAVSRNLYHYRSMCDSITS